MSLVNKFHVHVYKIVEKLEVETIAYNEVKAREIALAYAKEHPEEFGESDCKLLAIPFYMEEKIDERF